MQRTKSKKALTQAEMVALQNQRAEAQLDSRTRKKALQMEAAKAKGRGKRSRLADVRTEQSVGGYHCAEVRVYHCSTIDTALPRRFEPWLSSDELPRLQAANI
mgnify:FL=1